MTQSNPLRVGLIGAGGRWGPRAHVPALKGVSEAELYAVCTAHAETAQAAADKFGVTGVAKLVRFSGVWQTMSGLMRPLPSVVRSLNPTASSAVF